MSANQVLIIGVMGGADTTVVNLGPQENLFETMTVQQMRMKIQEKMMTKFGAGAIDDPADMRLLFAGREVQNKNSNGDDYTLDDFGIQRNSTLQVVFRVRGGSDDKDYNPDKHFGLKFTLKPDAITGEGADVDDDDDDDDDQSEERKPGSEWSVVSTCGRSDCVHPEYPSIRDAPMVKLPAVYLGGKKVPSRRACPTCGKVVQHSLQGCKFMSCQVCHVNFCFVCLNTEALCLSKRSGTWFGGCVDGVASKQTSIPVWSRKI